MEAIHLINKLNKAPEVIFLNVFFFHFCFIHLINQPNRVPEVRITIIINKLNRAITIIIIMLLRLSSL